jgi:hypothetical protein
LRLSSFTNQFCETAVRGQLAALEQFLDDLWLGPVKGNQDRGRGRAFVARLDTTVGAQRQENKQQKNDAFSGMLHKNLLEKRNFVRACLYSSQR